jgi:hypothetical protein
VEPAKPLPFSTDKKYGLGFFDNAAENSVATDSQIDTDAEPVAPVVKNKLAEPLIVFKKANKSEGSLIKKKDRSGVSDEKEDEEEEEESYYDTKNGEEEE